MEYKRIVSICAAASYVAISFSCLAQTGAATQPPSVPDSSGGEIIVTAQKRAERLIDVPLSISAATGDQLSSKGVTDVTQLEKVAPGFSYQASWLGAPILSIRGIGFFDNSVSASPTVTTYLDQVPLPYAPMTRGVVLDLGRVEVLKGPQGTVFGQNSTGGALNFIAAAPTDSVEAGIDLDIGRFSTVNSQAFVSGPIGANLSARVVARYESRDDWQKSYGPNDVAAGTRTGNSLGQRSFFNGRASILWEPSADTSFTLTASGWRDRSDTQAARFVEFAATAPRDPFNGAVFDALSQQVAPPKNARMANWDPDQDFARRDYFYQVALNGNIALNDAISLATISAYSRYHEDSDIDMDGTSLPVGVGGVRANIKSYYQELRLSGDLPRIKWMIGGNYSHDNIKERQPYLLAFTTSQHLGPLTWDRIEFRNDQKIDTLAAFGSLDYALTDTINLAGSVRYTDQNRDYAGCLADGGNGQIATAFSLAFGFANPGPGQCITQTSFGVVPPIIQDSLDQNNLSWRGSVTWKPNPDATLYATVSRGYKAGSFSLLPAIFSSQLSPAVQESVLAYEGGFKLSTFGRTVQISGAAFYYDYTDKQITGNIVILPFGFLPKLQNVPKSRVYGAELEATVRPVDGLTLTGGVTYVNSRIQEDPDPAVDAFGNPTTFVGEAFPNTPRWQGTFDAQYDFAIGANTRMFFGGSLTARTKTNATIGNSPGGTNYVLPGYTLVDLRAGIQSADESWRLQVWGRNVTDKFYRVANYRQIDTIVEVVGMPATYGVTLSYRYR
ncbi:MAG TPA: TonB-dependent receptor [Sphingobium sp.]|nr:TonB-dependent receptor [Sphingobium sp.]